MHTEIHSHIFLATPAALRASIAYSCDTQSKVCDRFEQGALMQGSEGEKWNNTAPHSIVRTPQMHRTQVEEHIKL